MRMGLLWACALLMMLASGMAVVLRPATGMIVMPTPRPAASHWVNVSTGNGSRYNGSLDSDPQRRPKVQGLYEVLAQESEVVAVHLVHVPYTDKYLYMERPSDKRSQSFQIAGTFDLVSRNWTRVNASDGLFCSGHAQTSDGQIVVAGGHKENGGYPSGMQSVRLFNEAEAPALLQNATVMQWKRWYPSVTLLPDEQIMIMGGTQQVGGSGGGNSKYELYNPIKAPYEYPLPNRTVDPCFVKQMKKMYYPFNYVLPTGDVYSFGEREGRVMVAQTGVYRQIPVPNPWNPYLAGDKLDGTNFTQFPYTASAAYSTLTFEDNYSSVELMIFGGAPVEATKNENLLSVSTVRRMNISWVYNETLKEYNYTYSPWSTEDLGIPRVMGDATVLPNGDVLLLNGAQAGVAGDSGSSFGSGGRSNYPNFWAQLYQPDLPYGKRVTYLAGSTIARMYHGTAALTTNATILVTGCDRCYRLSSDVPSYVSPGSRFEYRNEIFYPPYWFDFENKPEIVRVNGNVTWMPYNHTFSLDWGSEMGNTSMGNTSVPVTSVSLVAPSSTTHSFNMNQRVVKLEILSVNYNTSTLTLKTPPHPYIAPPQWYMIFAMNGKTMSKAKWIRLVDTLGQGKVVPTSITNGTLVTPYC